MQVLSLQELAEADVDVIVFAPCGFDIARSTRELHACGLLETALWQVSD